MYIKLLFLILSLRTLYPTTLPQIDPTFSSTHAIDPFDNPVHINRDHLCPQEKEAHGHKEAGHYLIATQTYQKCLQHTQSLLGNESIHLIPYYLSLGEISRLQKSYTNTTQYYQKALSLQKKHMPPSNPSRWTTQKYLADTFYEQASYKQAALTYNHLQSLSLHLSLPIEKKMYVMRRLGQSLQKIGALALATRPLGVFLIYREEKYGELSPKNLKWYKTLGKLYLQTQAPKKALFYINEVARMADYQQNNTLAQWAFFYKAKSYYALYSYKKAIVELDTLLRPYLLEKEKIPNNYRIGEAFYLLAASHMSLANYHKAALNYEKMSLIPAFMDKHTLKELMDLLTQIAQAHIAFTNKEKALYYLGQLKDAYETFEGNLEKEIAYIFHLYGRLYAQLQDYTSALYYHKKALGIQKKYNKKYNLALFNTYSGLAFVYSHLDKLDETFIFYQKMGAILQKDNRTESLTMSHIYYNTAAIYEKKRLCPWRPFHVLQNPLPPSKNRATRTPCHRSCLLCYLPNLP